MLVKKFGLKDTKVSELIEMLKQCDPDAVICFTEYEGQDEFFHSSIEIMTEYENETYISDNGEDEIGKIVCFLK
jgi:hypothetical protein